MARPVFQYQGGARICVDPRHRSRWEFCTAFAMAMLLDAAKDGHPAPKGCFVQRKTVDRDFGKVDRKGGLSLSAGAGGGRGCSSRSPSSLRTGAGLDPDRQGDRAHREGLAESGAPRVDNYGWDGHRPTPREFTSDPGPGDRWAHPPMRSSAHDPTTDRVARRNPVGQGGGVRVTTPGQRRGDFPRACPFGRLRAAPWLTAAERAAPAYPPDPARPGRAAASSPRKRAGPAAEAAMKAYPPPAGRKRERSATRHSASPASTSWTPSTAASVFITWQRLDNGERPGTGRDGPLVRQNREREPTRVHGHAGSSGSPACDPAMRLRSRRRPRPGPDLEGTHRHRHRPLDLRGRRRARRRWPTEPFLSRDFQADPDEDDRVRNDPMLPEPSRKANSKARAQAQRGGDRRPAGVPELAPGAPDCATSSSPDRTTAATSTSTSRSVVRGLMKHGRMANRPSTRVLDGITGVSARSRSRIRRLSVEGSSVAPRGHVADARDRQLRLHQQLQPRMRLGRIGDGAGEAHVALHPVDHALPPDLAQHRPHEDAARRRRQLHALVGPRPPITSNCDSASPARREAALEVRGVALGEGAGEQLLVAHERRADADAGREPLVRVDDPAVGLLEPGEQRRERAATRSRPARTRRRRGPSRRTGARSPRPRRSGRPPPCP